MISQFVSPYPQNLLGDLNFDFPEGTQAVGRLDEQSEGLLILTTDKTLNKRLLLPEKKHKRKYLVKVLRQVEEETLSELSGGIEILIKGRGAYTTQPCQVKIIPKPGFLWEDQLADSEFITYTWLEFTLTEGKNRQIRKMCKAVGHRCKRLIRTQIENLELGDLQPGEVKEFKKEELFSLLLLKQSE